ncbi:hypothetical protein LOC67_13275 [Stieleria sp. JC731]|uniref:hypothetical protein n=1 Tax=Pirellulaceae TaxID=2691357 RepID=UPI001E5A5E1B|nr:hypothetical protein [Stieleria sp. JC731]MCC9601522.1 hypothetical protein [Stieleria sp. JC731]
MKDRSQLLDQLLVFSATFVIVLGMWPAQAKRQVLHCLTGIDADTGNQKWTTYSMPVDHPSLPELKQSIENWQVPENDPVYVTAKWRRQVADFYEKSSVRSQASLPQTDSDKNVKIRSGRNAKPSSGPTTASISDSVMTVSFELPVDESQTTNSCEDDIASSSDLLAPLPVARGVIQQVGYETELNQVPHAELPMSRSAVVTSDYEVKSQEVASIEVASAEIDSPTMAVDSFAGSDAQYWRDVKAAADVSISKIESRAANPPVVLGDIQKAGPSQFAFNLAVLLAIAAVCGWVHWRKRTPVLSNVEFRDQPIGVLARIGTFGGIVTLAFISAVVVWY